MAFHLAVGAHAEPSVYCRPMRWVVVVVAVTVTGLASGCSWFSRGPKPIDATPGAVQEGIASWYGPGFQGRQTSSGEVFDQYDLTAAHPTLPHGTRVSVTNLRNQRSIEVRINDRGPYVDGRAIDLSYAAARSLDMIGPGTVPVRIEVLGPTAIARAPVRPVAQRAAQSPPHRPAKEVVTARYTVQVASFTTPERAARIHRLLRDRFEKVHVETLEALETHYRVRIGPYTDRNSAARTAATVASLGFPAIIMEDHVVLAQ